MSAVARGVGTFFKCVLWIYVAFMVLGWMCAIDSAREKCTTTSDADGFKWLFTYLLFWVVAGVPSVFVTLYLRNKISDWTGYEFASGTEDRAIWLTALCLMLIGRALRLAILP